MTDNIALPRSPAVLSSVDEFCRRKKIGRTHFYKEVAAGRISVIKIGKLTRITADAESEFDRLIGAAA